MGAEFSFTGRIQNRLNLRGFVSIGDWEYVGEVRSRDRNEDTNAVSNETIVDVDGGKVGDAAQFYCRFRKLM